jgi:hypothetical protein
MKKLLFILLLFPLAVLSQTDTIWNCTYSKKEWKYGMYGFCDYNRAKELAKDTTYVVSFAYYIQPVKKEKEIIIKDSELKYKLDSNFILFNKNLNIVLNGSKR